MVARSIGFRSSRTRFMIIAGQKPGRESPDETILFRHRGLSLSDIAFGHAMLEQAAKLGFGQRIRFA
jgi:alanine dehydrogenase